MNTSCIAQTFKILSLLLKYLLYHTNLLNFKLNIKIFEV